MKVKTIKRIELNRREHGLMLEALRRWLAFHKSDGTTLKTAWLGLGTKTTYKPATDSGLMEFTSYVSSRCMGWLTLTDLGAKIVQAWIDLGHTKIEDFELKEVPNYFVEIEAN